MDEMIFIKVTGWSASILFAICGIPQAVKTYKIGHAKDLSALFLLTWILGEILMTIYVLLEHGLDGPLLFNYAGNLLALLVIWRYKLFPREY